MAQKGPLGAGHQEAHDVVADAGESLHFGLGEVGSRDALEAPDDSNNAHVLLPSPLRRRASP